MAIRKSIFKNTAIVLVIALIAIQFIHPKRNESSDTTNDLTHIHPMPDTVASILKTSCYDCHSNHTEYPWYANIQPVAWWLDHHIDEGKHDLNFNEFATYRINRQYHKLEQITKEVNKGDMPISSYTLIHRYAILSDDKKKLVADWANSLHDSMQHAYPADSLKMPKRKKG